MQSFLAHDCKHTSSDSIVRNKSSKFHSKLYLSRYAYCICKAVLLATYLSVPSLLNSLDERIQHCVKLAIHSNYIHVTSIISHNLIVTTMRIIVTILGTDCNVGELNICMISSSDEINESEICLSLYGWIVSILCASYKNWVQAKIFKRRQVSNKLISVSIGDPDMKSIRE